MGRTLLAGLLGGLAMFIWSSLAHTVLPLGHIGVNQLPEASAAPAALQADAGAKAGLYMFPGVGAGTNPHVDAEAQAQMMEKVKTNPSGMVVYHPPGRSTDMAPFLVSEAVIEVLQGLLIALVLVRIAGGFAVRLATAAAIGAAAALTTNGSYAIWYGFPIDFSIAAMVMTFVGYVVAGAVAAWLLGWRRKPAE